MSGGEDIKSEAMKAGREIVARSYDDVVHPAAKELGKTLETAVQAVNAALLPIRGIVWGTEQIKIWIETRVARRLVARQVPPERVQEPDPYVAGPAYNAVRFAENHPDLQDMFANVLATALDSETAHKAHPGFVEIIKQLAPDEARILAGMKALGPVRSYPLIMMKGVTPPPARSGTFPVPKEDSYVVFARHITTFGEDFGLEHHRLVPEYIDNLCRLGIASCSYDLWLAGEDEAYEKIKNGPAVKRITKAGLPEGYSVAFANGVINITDFGAQFMESCVSDPEPFPEKRTASVTQE